MSGNTKLLRLLLENLEVTTEVLAILIKADIISNITRTEILGIIEANNKLLIMGKMELLTSEAEGAK